MVVGVTRSARLADKNTSGLSGTAAGGPRDTGTEAAEFRGQEGAGYHQRAERDDQHHGIDVRTWLLRGLIS